MLHQNDFYGHATILRSYCAVQGRPLLPGHLQHGWNPGIGHGSDSYYTDPWPMYVWARHNLEHCQAAGFDVIPIGSPFLYLLAMEPIPSSPPTRGIHSLLAYPHHGWERQQLLHDMERYAQTLDTLTEEGYGPITVCLYWHEYEKPECRAPFEERGYELTTNGHRENNEQFLRKQRQDIIDHAFVTSNRIGTSGFYALAAGRPFFLAGSPVGVENTNDPTGEKADAWQRKHFPQLLIENFSNTCHRQIGEKQLGLEYRRTPEGLRQLFSWTTTGIFLRSWRRIQRGLRYRWPWLYGKSS